VLVKSTAQSVALRIEHRQQSRVAPVVAALLLKDCGCSGNTSKTFHAFGSDDLKARHNVDITDWTRVGKGTFNTRSIMWLPISHSWSAPERGSTLARQMGLSEDAASGILNLDEHWNGGGNLWL
jgi:hypothetical protein